MPCFFKDKDINQFRDITYDEFADGFISNIIPLLPECDRNLYNRLDNDMIQVVILYVNKHNHPGNFYIEETFKMHIMRSISLLKSFDARISVLLGIEEPTTVLNEYKSHLDKFRLAYTLDPIRYIDEWMDIKYEDSRPQFDEYQQGFFIDKIGDYLYRLSDILTKYQFGMINPDVARDWVKYNGLDIDLSK